MSLASLLTVLTSSWATGIASVLLALTGGGLIYGEDSWTTWILRAISAFNLLVLGANFLSTLGVVS